MKMFRKVRDHNPHNFCAWCLQLRLPLLIWYARKYVICEDAFKTGWHRFDILLSFDKHQSNGIGIRFHYGWCPVKTYRTEFAV